MSYVTSALGKNESVIIHSKKHPVILFGPFCSMILGLAVVFALIYLAVMYQPQLAVPALLLLIFPPLYFGYMIMVWWNEEYFLTTHRIIQSEGVVNKRIVDSSLEKVNDVVFSQWWLERLLDFGDIEILTASDVGVNRLDNIRSPLKFKIAMMDQKHNIATEVPPAKDTTAVDDEKATLISNLEELKRARIISEYEFEQKKKQLIER